jgi:hypothetical protein
VLDEFLYLTATFTNQSNHDDIGLSEAGHHPQQHALADTTAGKEPQTLATTHSEQTIDHPDADIQRLTDRLTSQWVDGAARERNAGFMFQGAAAIQWIARTI